MPTLLRLSLDNPCSENWDAMNTVATGRFCQSCQKTVTDFSQYTDSELMDFFKKRNYQPLCGRIQQHRINKIYIELPNTLFKSRVPFWKKFLAICLVVFGSSLFTPENSYSQAVMTVQVVNGKKVKSQKSKKHKRKNGRKEKKDGSYTVYTEIFLGGLIATKTIPLSSANLKDIINASSHKKEHIDTISISTIPAQQKDDKPEKDKRTENNLNPFITSPTFRLKRPRKTKPSFKKK